jgi:hypothetical protein
LTGSFDFPPVTQYNRRYLRGENAMTEHRYTTEERVAQLNRLAAALRELIAELRTVEPLTGNIADYETLLGRCEVLLKNGFAPEETTALGRAVPDLFYRHKEWEPPRTAWFERVEERLRPVLEAAARLSEIGYY